ncbi:MAG: type II/IV secretion system protein [Candidatus Liptonbacteria bacterium]|nr:type II/IV secretion system protein [Candidatus Liptonbacteria bacterium]
MRDIKTLKTIVESKLGGKIEDVSVVEMVDIFIEYAYNLRASDIHIEPGVDMVRLRFRIDGILRDMLEKGVPKAIHQELVSRIKVLAGLRTDEHLLPQDGRFRAQIEGFGDIDIRVSIMPTYHGENAILRLLAETSSFVLEDLGFSASDLAKVKRAITKPYGMILANGPTGSGKTTTLYTILKTLNSPEVSIITIEDPIEYSLRGTTQIQVDNKVGLTFANGLRSILRQDPNVVMVGEIRDEETADIAVNASLTGHLVLSTLHTNDAATTFPRLIDMGIPPFLAASTVNIAMGQRLVRTICKNCKKLRILDKDEMASLKEIIPDVDKKVKTFYRGEGCDSCTKTGYEGRTGIREVLEIDDKIRDLIMSRANAQQIKDAAVTAGMTTMLQDGLDKANRGITTIEEILRIIHE